MKTVYVADDGKKFDSSEECLAYEDDKNSKDKERRDLEKQIADAWNKYIALSKEYNEKYINLEALDEVKIFRKLLGI